MLSFFDHSKDPVEKVQEGLANLARMVDAVARSTQNQDNQSAAALLNQACRQLEDRPSTSLNQSK